ncbi:winged helix-turn-helix domain-containing protein [Methylobacterium sp. P31]
MSVMQFEKCRLLIAEDDKKIQNMLAKYFCEEGFLISTSYDVVSTKNKLINDSPDIVLLDLTLNGQDGLAILREFNNTNRPGFIIISGRKTVFDRVVGLELGADDYVTKPFSLREVMARVKALFRRRRETTELSQHATDRVARFAFYKLNIGRRQLVNPQGSEVPLTTGEYNLLRQLVMYPGRVLTRDQLMDLTRERHRDSFDRTIDAQISRLRRKIEQDSRKPQLIKSVHGAGYIFSCKVDWVNNPVEANTLIPESGQIEVAA